MTHDRMMLLLGHVFYLLSLFAFGLQMPETLWDPQARDFILIIGLIAIWRYGWAAVNWIRFLIYTRLVFPRWRKQAEVHGEEALPNHVYLMVTSFRIGAETTRRVYASVMEEAIRYNRPCTIVASIVERADQVLIKQIFQHYQPPPHITLTFVRIAGTGKRDALAVGFRAISRRMPRPDDVVAVIDGDSMLEPDLIKRSAIFFRQFPNMAALTTDEHCEVEGNWLFKEWYNMRFAQRHVFMSSVSLSKRVLTLTGRMSMFRAGIVTSPEFIQRVELDWIDHWRLGRFKFLTGDDKSSWFEILSRGHEMLYLPDVNVLTVETPPHPSFFKSSVMLSRRWFGNMLRTNSRAIALGPRVCGLFPWISIIDQRISMWTSLTGPTIAIMATLFVTPIALLYYLIWIMITRYVITLSLLASRSRVSAMYPFLLFYNQIVGSFIKTIVLFRLDKQRWTRQNTVLNTGRSRWGEVFAQTSSTVMHAFAVTLYIAALGWVSGIL